MAISARIDELKKKFDENPRRYFASLANEYRKAGDLEQALFICQEYLPQQPGHMSGHIVLAQTLYEMGRLTDAKAEFESALSLDPENLIALRHLGDIARQSGDPRTARNWYQRVLEADPRNSEIVDVLASLRTTPMASAPAISAVPPTPLSSPVMPPPTPLSTPVMPPAAPAPDEHAEPAKEEHELLDFESITLGETPLSTPVVQPPVEHADAALELSMPVGHSTPDLDFATESFEADAFAIAIPESAPAVSEESPEPPIESAKDIELGLIEEDFAPASTNEIEPTIIEGLRSYEAGTLVKGSEPIDKSLDTESYYDVLHGSGRSTPPEQSHPTHEIPPSDDDFAPGFIEHDTSFGVEEHVRASETPVEAHASFETPHSSSTPVEGLESFEDDVEGDFSPRGAPTPETSHTPPASATPVTSFTPVAPTTAIEPAEPVAHASSDTPVRQATPASGSETFVTETMADLYLSQGHVDSALDIYRKLLEQRPDDARLSERVRDAESRLSGRHTPRVATPVAAEPVASRGPSIREFLVALIGAKPGQSQAATSREPLQDFASAETDPAVSGSIDALFSSAEGPVSKGDSTSALAEAFSEHGSDTPMLEGQPAHPAASELSLDQVFKGATPSRTEAQPQGFSFDQFFAGEANASPASPANGNTSPVEGTDDIAQFNAWLNGLKKT